jgi:hypothetical protein
MSGGTAQSIVPPDKRLTGVEEAWAVKGMLA